MDFRRLSMQKNDDNKHQEQQKVPKGFEKFFKKKQADSAATKGDEKSASKKDEKPT